jgi:hypothetical protein
MNCFAFKRFSLLPGLLACCFLSFVASAQNTPSLDQTFNARPPGSALVFEVHKNVADGANTCASSSRSFKGAEQPSVAPIFVPGCSGPAPAYVCSVDDFARVVTAAIDDRLVERATK